MIEDHQRFMAEALKQARLAEAKGEIPIGAIIVSNGSIIARAYNLSETLRDATAHAEMQAITMATESIGGKYLYNCTIYVTVEPCPMCAGALAWSQISNIVYGAPDPKKGYSLFHPTILHPKTKVVSGILEQECGEIVSNFFKKLRK